MKRIPYTKNEQICRATSLIGRFRIRTVRFPGAGESNVNVDARRVYPNRTFLWCSQAKGEKNPNPGGLDEMTSKAEIIKVLNDTFAYCDSAYTGLTDASGAEVIDITQESGRQTRSLRFGLLTLNYAHNNEIYGSMVAYLRMKDIVPPASEPRPQQKK